MVPGQRALRRRCAARSRAAQSAACSSTFTRCSGCPPASSTPRGSRRTSCSSTRKAGSGRSPWTERLWVYDLRTNKHFTLKQNRLKRSDLDDFVACYNPDNRHEREPTWSEKNLEGRWSDYSYEEIVARDKASLDIFWLRDESLEDSANLPEPHILAEEIADDLRAALEQIEDVLMDLQARVPTSGA